MTKVYVTGHTSGIGKGIFDALSNRNGWNVYGFSKSTGWDIDELENIESLSDKANTDDVDIFINNAYHPWHQTELLYCLFDDWRYKEKTIINISSNAGEVIARADPQKYAIAKKTLSDTCIQFQTMKCKCKVIDVKFGYTDTDRIAHIKGVQKLTIDEVVQNILWIIDQPKDMHIKSISFAKK